MLERLPPGWKRSRLESAERQYSLIVKAGSLWVRFRAAQVRTNPLVDTRSRMNLSRVGIETALARFETDVKMYVAQAAHARIFVHAGVVGWRGRAVVIPGLTLSGKSTLVAALVKAGAIYYSDEYAVFDARGRVHAYPSPLALRKPGILTQTPRSIESLGGRVGSRPLSVDLIAVTKYKTGERWRPRRLTPGQGVLAMLANTVPARRASERALASLRRAVDQAVVLEGLRGGAKQTARALLDAVERRRA
jgi:hypothetical protein